MLKKAVLGAVILICLVSGASAEKYKIPYDYRFVKSLQYGALIVFKKNNIFVSIIDLDKANINLGNVEEAGNGKFVKNSMNTWWSDYRNSKTLAMYNGQFFSMNGFIFSDTTTLSFPLKSYWYTINSSKDYGTLKTLYIDNYGKVKIFPDYRKWYLKYSRSLIVGLSPKMNKGINNKTGRFYIVGIPRNSNEKSFYRRDMIFTAVSSTQKNMDSEIKWWNGLERDTIMMDGSGSAQMRVGSLKVYGDGGYRHLPNVIAIEKNK